MAKIIIPTAPDGSWRRCFECAHSNRECDKCEKRNIRINKVMYACPEFATPVEEFERKRKELLLESAKRENMLNFLLTAMCLCATATQSFLIDFCSHFEKTKSESNWRHKRQQAANEILRNAERMQTLHAQFFQEDMNKVHSEHGTKDFDYVAFNNHAKDAYELCRLLMLYLDRCWDNEEAATEIVNFISGIKSGDIFSDKDIERFRMRG